MSVLVPRATELTLGQILRAVAERQPEAPALLSFDRSFTWADLDAEVDRVAAFLAHAGLVPRSVLGLLCTKRPELVTVFLAVTRLGAIVAPVNHKLLTAQVADQLGTAGITHVLTERGFEDLIFELRRDHGLLRSPGALIYAGPVGSEGAWSLDDAALLDQDPPAWEGRPDTPCYLNYTSGTTGRPKGALTTHANIVYNALSGVEGLGFTGRDVFFGMFSVFSHPHEIFHRSLLVGGAFVVVDTLSPRVVCETVERFRVTWMMAVPSFYALMLDQGGVGAQGRYDLSSLRVLESGGAWVGAHAIEEMEARFPGATFMPVWGSTETTGVALAMAPGQPRCPGATGKPAPTYSIRVVDASGCTVPDGQEGEMWVSGPAVTRGYVEMPEETATLFRDGWYRTEDWVRRDEEGFIHFLGRQSDMIKVAGIRVYPLELERVLAAHPGVADAVVVRAEERLRGEVPRAVIRALAGFDLTADDLRAWCRTRLPAYKQPRIIEVWPEIPRLPNGKVDRKAIAAAPLRVPARSR
jgi:long-chain acyl-CoA synthetase